MCIIRNTTQPTYRLFHIMQRKYHTNMAINCIREDMQCSMWYAASQRVKFSSSANDDLRRNPGQYIACLKMTDILSEKIPYCSCHNLAEHSILPAEMPFLCRCYFFKIIWFTRDFITNILFLFCFIFVALGLAAFVYQHVRTLHIPVYIYRNLLLKKCQMHRK